MPQLECLNLTLGYDTKIVLYDISFKVNAKDFLCIVGENGSGKTTLMKALLKLKSPMSGRVTMGDGLKPDNIGYLPQQAAIQDDFPASVKEVVLSGCLNRCGLRPFYNKEQKQLAKDSMETLGVDSLASRCYRELSGGQQRRVLLARALCAADKILLLDEPVSGLDPKAAAEMYELTGKLNRSGITIIMITHDVAASVKYASHILHTGKQKLLFFGAKEEYTENESKRA
ncbi:MAG: ABC transporter ATP-binding protein [Chitinispirillales bacterium]|jgi:zinc transport system ATP-binding protein|nr:ABC transporter ATP-binding protein [Chitinispirillales bacterium]